MKKYQNLINKIKQLAENCQHNDNWDKHENLLIQWVIEALEEENLTYARYLATRSSYHDEYLKILGVNRQFTDEQKQAIVLFISDLWDMSCFARRQVNKDNTIKFLKTYGITEV